MIKLILSLCLIIHSHSIQAMDSAPPTATKLTELQTSLQTLQTKLTDLSGYLTILRLHIQQHPLVKYFTNDIPEMLLHRSFIDFICSLETTWNVEFEPKEKTLELILKNNPSYVVYLKQNAREHKITYSENARTISAQYSKIDYFQPTIYYDTTKILLATDNNNLTLQDGLKLMQHIANTAPIKTPYECFYTTHHKYEAPEILKEFIQLLIDQGWIASFKEKNNFLGVLSTLFLKKDIIYLSFEENASRNNYSCIIKYNKKTQKTPVKTWDFTKKPSTPTDDFTLEEAENEKTRATTFDAIHIFINQELAKGS